MLTVSPNKDLKQNLKVNAVSAVKLKHPGQPFSQGFSFK